ncbi:MAG: biotin synthase BioB [Muribaculaceae bacterium]|nr:biotin synthase BioB [Muribaculaceae bacterium]
MELSVALDLALAGTPLSVDDALTLEAYGTDELCDAADKVRLQHCGNRIHTCSIVNARSGRCSEDCKWCSQSGHHSTGIDEYEYIGEEELMIACGENDARGVQRFALVTSGRRVPPAHTAAFCRLLDKVRSSTSMSLCVSMGLVDEDQLRMLHEAGVERYHCNLETSPRFFPSLCSTHSQADKLATIAAARRVGMSVCVGGIIGMGETMRDRLELAEAAREAGASALPLNILNPIPGTPLGSTPLLPEEEVVRSVALMRFIIPTLTIHFAGGRGRISRKSTLRMLRGGANGAMVGNLLTTVGNDMNSDYDLFAEAGYEV